MAAPKFEVVEDPDQPTPDQTPTSRSADLGTQALLLGLQTLSKRALIAIDNLFCLLTVFSVFWLCLSIPHPDTQQLIEIGGYALFVLAANVIVRRK
jgi:hypothetical protein